MLFRSLSAYHTMQIDGIVLGCTHYIFIRDAIKRYAAMHLHGTCTLFDGNAATVYQLKRVLEAQRLLNVGTASGNITFHTSGDPAQYAPLFELLLHRP